MTPSEVELFQAIDGTWPAYALHSAGVWTLREGRGAGQRVSAASTICKARKQDIIQAADLMKKMGQTPLFMVRGEQPELDELLEGFGYKVVDPVDVLMMRTADLAYYEKTALEVVFTKYPLAILAEIWRGGGIDAPRLEVMCRAAEPKTCLFSRYDNHPAGAGFIACHNKIAMVHAVEILEHARRKGVAESMMRGAGWWAMQQGVEWFTCLATSENTPAQRLYRKMGMEVATRYHYRKLIT